MDNLINDIFNKKNTVVITGAGISTLSGIPDFRSKNGLYKKYKNLESILSKEYIYEEPEEFYNFYTKNMLMQNVKPNIIHETLAKLEEKGYISCIITQNIDNLHKIAGSKNVLPLHGDSKRYYCTFCKKEYSVEEYLENGFVCKECKGLVRPDIILYGEQINPKNLHKAQEEVRNADVIIVLGTSLLVTTVANLLEDYIKNKDESKKLYIINNNPTPFDSYAKTYSEDLDNVFKKIKKLTDNKY